jgi:uncharacterized protein (DUF1015 family)
VCQSVPVPRLDPFRGARYEPHTAPLDQVIAPPFDVVGPSERELLANRNPANAIHVELPQPDPTSGRDRYAAAAYLFEEWLSSRVLVADPAPALYPYRMTTQEGAVTTGVVGALGIGDDVLPHEETMPKPRSDRLDLLRATRVNTSPIWGLSLTAGFTATFSQAGPAAASARDDDGVLHELWRVDDPGTIRAVQDAAAASPVVIADGHHRYTTATVYRDEMRAKNGDVPAPHDAVMALVVELAEEHLHVEAIHRLVADVPDDADLLGLLSRSFEPVRAGTATPEVVRSLDASGSPAYVTAEGAWALSVRPGAFDASGTDLVAGLVDDALRALPRVSLSYTPSSSEALSVVERGDARAAILLTPVRVDQIARWAGAGRRMPAKTTYFSPKPRTGMVFRLLDADS